MAFSLRCLSRSVTRTQCINQTINHSFNHSIKHTRTFATISVDQLRAGNLIELNGKTFTVESSSVNMRGRAHTTYTLELRDNETGTKNPTRMRPSDKVELIQIEIDQMQFLYADDHILHVMNPTTFEQIEIPIAAVSEELRPFLQDGMNLRCNRNKGTYVYIQLPDRVACEVAEASGKSGGTRDINDNTGREAKLTNGAKIKVPNHIQTGDKIWVRTDILEYHSVIRD